MRILYATGAPATLVPARRLRPPAAGPLRCLASALLFLVATCGHAHSLPPTVTALLERYQIPASTVSLTVQSVESEQPLLHYRGDTSRNPASVIKLLTTLAALELLGPEYQWQTRYLAAGEIRDGVLHGELIIQGNGDPFLVTEKFWQQLSSLRQIGIRQIQGDLVLDATAFALPPHDRDAFDGQGQRLYNVGPDAVLTNFSATSFVLQPIRGEVRVFAEPPLHNLSVVNRIRPERGKCIHRNHGWRYQLHRQGEQITARFDGTYRPECGRHTIGRSIVENHDYTFRLFGQLWRSLGGQHNGGLRVGAARADAQLLLSHASDSLADIITGINKYSNNVMARQLLLTIGLQLYGRPAAIEAGIAGIHNWLGANNIALPGLVIANGAGLSRRSQITTGGLINLLQHAWRSDYRPEFLSSLPLAALDGTMRKRLQQSPLRGRARIKTGLIRGVRSMAGYVRTGKRQYLAIAMLIESENINHAIGNRIQDAVLEWAYRQ